MKIIAFAVAVLLMLCGCAVNDTYTISEEFISLMWNVDYRDFSAEETTRFAKQYYSEEYLEDYLSDIEYNSGELQNKEEQLISRIGDFSDIGIEKEVYDGIEYIVQNISAVIYIDHFKPEDPGMSFFEEGKRFEMKFYIYFLRENGKVKIDSFGFEPIGEEFLPASEKERLSPDMQAELYQAAKEYLFTRNEFTPESFDIDEQWNYYQEACSERFLSRDEINKEFLYTFYEEIERYGVSVEVLSYNIITGSQKQSHFDGEVSGFYYWAELSYTIEIIATEEYYRDKNITKEHIICEKLYFEKINDGFRLFSAEYL